MRIARGLGWGLLGLLALLVLVFGALQTPWGKNLLRDFVADILNDTFAGRVEIDGLGGFLPFDLTLEGVRLYDPEDQVVLSVAELEAKVHPFALINQTVHLSRVLVRQPGVTVFDAEGRIGLLRALAPKNPTPEEEVVADESSGSSWILQFDDIKLEQGELQRLLPGDQDLALGDLSLDLALGMRPEGLFWPRLALKASPIGSSELAQIIGGDIIIATSGGMANSEVEIKHVSIEAGPHRLVAVGNVGLGESTSGTLTIADLRVDLDRLPISLKDLIGELESPAYLTGLGKVSLDADGQAIVDLGLHSQLALILIEGGAKLDFSELAPSFLADWTAHTHIVDLAFTPRMMSLLPPEGRDKHYSIDLRVHGIGIPPGVGQDGGSLWAEMELSEDSSASLNSGAGQIRVRRVRDAAQDRAPSFLVNADLADLGFQPWLQLANEPALQGSISQFALSSYVSLPSSGLPRVMATADFDLGLSGLLHATEPPSRLHANPLKAHAQMRWQGEGLPLGTVEISGNDIAFEEGGAQSLALTLSLSQDNPTRATIAKADLTVGEAYWGEEFKGERIGVEATVDVTDTLNQGHIPEGIVEWNIGRVAALDKRLAQTTGKLNIRNQANGLRVTGRVGADSAVIDRQLSLGGADLDLDVLLGKGVDSPVGGPITARVDGTLTQLRQGANSIAGADLRGIHADVPLGPNGLQGYLGVRGDLALRGISVPQVKVDSALAQVDARVDLARLDVLGDINILADGAKLSNGQKVDTLKLTAKGIGQGKIVFSGGATQGKDASGRPLLELAIEPGEFVIPSGKRPLSASLGRITLKRGGADWSLLSLSSAHYSDKGWLEIDPLTLRSGKKGGLLQLEGRFNPNSGAMKAKVQTENIELASWAEFISDVLRWANLAEPQDLKNTLGGTLALDLSADGTLSKPDLYLRFRGQDLTYQGEITEQGAKPKVTSDPLKLTFDLLASVKPEGLKTDMSVRWGPEGMMSLKGQAPAQLSLVPFQFNMAEDATLSAKLNVKEPQIESLLAKLKSLLPSLDIQEVAGDLELSASLEGPLSAPEATLDIQSASLALFDSWKGSLKIVGEAKQNGTILTLDLTDKENEAPIAISVNMPLSAPQAINKAAPMEWVRQELNAKPFRVDISIPETALSKTPATTFLPLALQDSKAEVSLSIGGRLSAPEAKGHAYLKDLPSNLNLAVKFGTVSLNGRQTNLETAFLVSRGSDNDLPGLVDLNSQLFGDSPTNVNPLRENYPMNLAAVLAPPTEPTPEQLSLAAERAKASPRLKSILMDGRVTVPNLSQVLVQLDEVSNLINNEQLRLEISTRELRATEVLELQESAGDLMTQLFPDGWVSLYASANGSARGLKGLVFARVRTTPPKNARDSARRNIADDVRLSLLIDEKTDLSLVLSQDLLTFEEGSNEKPPLNTLSLKMGLDFSIGRFLSGKLPSFDKLDIKQGILAAQAFEFGGQSTGLRSILGQTEGYINGIIEVSGTIGTPKFRHLDYASQTANMADPKAFSIFFKTLDIAPAGLVHENVSVNLKFDTEQSWSLTLPHLYNNSLRARNDNQYCEDVPLPEDKKNTPYLVANIKGTIPSLDTKQMALNGCIGLKDFQALNTKELKGRVDGSLALSGNVSAPQIRGTLTVIDGDLSPSFASKSVRPIGTPMDVTLVRGAPKKPAEIEVKSPYQTGMILDVTAKLAKDTIRVEPSISQPFGEVRALVYPHGQLRIVTNAGELAITGIIEVPKERIYLYGKTFILDADSRVTFLGDMATDPQLQFTARHNISSVDLTSIGLTTDKESEVVVRVSGSASDPKLEFNSTPAMDETNILSVIALGIPAGGGEALGDAVQDQLLTAFMGMATMQFARDFQQRLALDVLRIEANSSNPADTRLTVGKRLTEDVFLNYYLNLAAREGEDQQSGSLEYRLTRFLSLLGRAGDSGDVGLEINLRFQDTPPPPRNSRVQAPRPVVNPSEVPPASVTPPPEPAKP